MMQSRTPKINQQTKILLNVSTVEWRPKHPPTFHGKYQEDVTRWTGYMGDFLTFLNGLPGQDVQFAVTYLRGAAQEW